MNPKEVAYCASGPRAIQMNVGEIERRERGKKAMIVINITGHSK